MSIELLLYYFLKDIFAMPKNIRVAFKLLESVVIALKSFLHATQNHRNFHLSVIDLDQLLTLQHLDIFILHLF